MLAEVDGAFVGSYAENVRRCFDGTLSPVGHITLPWDNLRWTGPEAACLGADAVIVAPLLYSSIPSIGRRKSTPIGYADSKQIWNDSSIFAVIPDPRWA